jgi:hypothetical protein
MRGSRKLPGAKTQFLSGADVQVTPGRGGARASTEPAELLHTRHETSVLAIVARVPRFGGGTAARRGGG